MPLMVTVTVTPFFVDTYIPIVQKSNVTVCLCFIILLSLFYVFIFCVSYFRFSILCPARKGVLFR